MSACLKLLKFIGAALDLHCTRAALMSAMLLASFSQCKIEELNTDLSSVTPGNHNTLMQCSVLCVCGVPLPDR